MAGFVVVKQKGNFSHADGRNIRYSAASARSFFIFGYLLGIRAMHGTINSSARTGCQKKKDCIRMDSDMGCQQEDIAIERNRSRVQADSEQTWYLFDLADQQRHLHYRLYRLFSQVTSVVRKIHLSLPCYTFFLATHLKVLQIRVLRYTRRLSHCT